MRQDLCSVRWCPQPTCREAAVPFCLTHWLSLSQAARDSLWAQVTTMYETGGEEPGEEALRHATMAAATWVESVS